MRRRLAVVSDAVYPWNTGGKEVRHHELLTRLARRGLQVDVYTMHWWSGGAKTHAADGITYHALCRRYPLYAGARRSILQALVFALASFRMVTKRFDVVEVDAIPFLPLFPMRLVTWVRRRPMVATWHEYWGRDYWVAYLGARGRLAAAIERSAALVPDRLIAASDGTGERLVGPRGRRGGVTVVPNGISVTELGAVVGENDHPELLVVGRLLDHKKVDVVIDALAVLSAAGRRLRLRVIGEGPERAALVALAERRGVSAQVSFDDFLPDRNDLMSAMAGAKVLVFPSVREGFGMVALEALALGTPVVTSDHSDNFARHLVVDGYNGAVRAATPPSIADGVAVVLAAGDTLQDQARRSAERFDWDVLAGRAEEVYA